MNVLVVDDNDPFVDSSFAGDVSTAVDPFGGSKVAIDCEGVSLSRKGSLEILSVCFKNNPSCVYLVDFQKACVGAPRIAAIKRLLESDNVQKIIHDCRKDCDALFHQFNIKMVNIHDTSCFYKVMFGKNGSLNEALAAHGVKTNNIRNNAVYKLNPSYWATRPLTSTMKSWAAGDVCSLFTLAANQETALTKSHQQNDLAKAKSMSIEYSLALVHMKAIVISKHIKVGLFIGKGGQTVKRLEATTNCAIYPNFKSDSTQFLVYYPSEAALQLVVAEMNRYMVY